MPDPAGENEGLRSFLAERDVPCPGCGYNLRGLTSEACPECGGLLRLAVIIDDAWIGRLVAAVVPIAGIAFAATVPLLIFFLATVLDPGAQHDLVNPFTIVLSAMAVLLGVPAAALSGRRGRAWFRQRTNRGRNTVVATCWCMAGLALAGFVKLATWMYGL